MWGYEHNGVCWETFLQNNIVVQRHGEETELFLFFSIKDILMIRKVIPI